MSASLYKISYASDMPYQADTFSKRLWLGVLVALLVAVPLLLPSSMVHMVNLVLLASLGALSMNVLTGNAGLISLGHAAFVATGGFASAILVADFGIPPWITLFAGIAAGALAGFIASLPAIRVRGLYLILSTLAIHSIVVLMFGEYQTRGHSGGFPIPRLAFGSLQMKDSLQWYYFLLAIVVATTLFCMNLLRSRVGRAWSAIRDRDIAAEVLGVNVSYYKILAFVFTSGVAGLLGSLSAFYAGYVDVGNYTLWMALGYAVMAIIGGFGSILGSFLGAAFVTLLPYGIEAAFKMLSVPPRLEDSKAAVQFGIFGLFVIVFVLVEPRGLVGIWQRIRNYFELWPYKQRPVSRSSR